MAQADPLDLIGKIFDGKVLVDRLLGADVARAVYLARQLVPSRVVLLEVALRRDEPWRETPTRPGVSIRVGATSLRGRTLPYRILMGWETWAVDLDSLDYPQLVALLDDDAALSSVKGAHVHPASVAPSSLLVASAQPRDASPQLSAARSEWRPSFLVLLPTVLAVQAVAQALVLTFGWFWNGPTPLGPWKAPSVTVEYAKEFRLVGPKDEWMADTPLTAQQARSRSHERLIRQGALTRIVSFGPRGVYRAEAQLAVEADGTRVVRWLNARGKATLTRRTRGDLSWYSLRSGSAPDCPVTRDSWEGLSVHSSACLTPKLEPQPDDSGCHVQRTQLDAKGRVTHRTCWRLDAQGGLLKALNAHGVHEVRIAFQENDSSSHRYFDTEGRPTPDHSDCHGRDFLRTGPAELRISCVNAAGVPHRSNQNPVATNILHESPDGCSAEYRGVGTDGQPVAVRGSARSIDVTNALCDTHLLTSFGADGEPDRVPPQRRLFRYDSDGNQVEQRCADGDGIESACETGDSGRASVVRYDYDLRGRKIRQRVFDTAGAPVTPNRSVPHEQRTQYSDDGLIEDSRYFDAGGSPAPIHGATLRRVTHLPTGDFGGDAYFDAQDKPVVTSLGFHRTEYHYDSLGQLDRIQLLGVNGEAVAGSFVQGRALWTSGATSVAIERSAGKRFNRFLGLRGEQLALIECSEKQPCF